MTKLTDFTIKEARKALDKGEFSAVELTKAHIEAMEKGRELNAFITETPDLAIEMAKKSDEKIKQGKAGILEGIPVAQKDLFCTKGVLTTAASHILDGFVPPYESTVSQKMNDEGAVLLGKLNLDEFAMGGSNETSYYGPVKNPWKAKGSDVDLVSGGSSGGSASAVAAKLCMAATGTDTGGSIRQPSSYCGIVGIKPTYGRCSRYGIIAFASSLDQAGAIARNTEDAALLLQSMAGFDAKDSTSAPVEVPNFSNALNRGVKGLRIGIPKEYRPQGLNAEVAKVWDNGIKWLEEAGAIVEEISLPHTDAALATYYVLAPAEASSNLARYDGVRFGLRKEGKSLDELYMNTRAEGFGKEVRRRIMIGTYVLSAGYYDAYYIKAQKVRALVASDFKNAFTKVDAILTPTAPTPAFPIGDKSMENPINMWLNDTFTIPTSLAGLPGMSVPAGLSDNGLPMGLQIIGKAFDEETVFAVGRQLELSANFKAVPTYLEGK